MRTVATPDLTGDFYTSLKDRVESEWKPVRMHYSASNE
jgi:hypothetical protein